MAKIFITGTSSGIGQYIALGLSREYGENGKHKHKVVGCSKSGGCRDTEFSSVLCDTRNINSVRSSLQYALFQMDDVDIIINNAGVNILQYIHLLDQHDIDEILDTNIKGYINVISSAVLMQKAGFIHLKKIINIGSVASRVPMTASLVYNASKAAVDMITKQCARELAPHISVYGVNPGKMEKTKMTEYVDNIVPKLRGWSAKKAKEYQLSAIPMRRYGHLTELYSLVSFLVNTAPEYMTGSIIEVAGGQ